MSKPITDTSWPGQICFFCDSYYPLPNSLLQTTWYYTTIWTIGFTFILYFTAGMWGYVSFHKSKAGILFPFFFSIVGMLSGLVRGTILGCLMHGVYQYGNLKVTANTTFMWAIIQAVLIILYSFRGALHSL